MRDDQQRNATSSESEPCLDRDHRRSASVGELDPRTGGSSQTSPLPGFSVTAVLRVGAEAWLGTADGHV